MAAWYKGRVTRRETLAIPLWTLPNLLSLDAPLVAVLWQAVIARHLGLALQPVHALVLGASVWLVYAADRWLDGWRIRNGAPTTLRHAFYMAWRGPLALLWLAVLALDLALALGSLRPHELAAGGVLLAATTAYFVHAHGGRGLGRWLPKEVQVAVLMAGGSALFLVGRAPWGALLPPTLAWGLLALLNTAFIAQWERHLDDGRGRAASLSTSRAGHAHLPALAAGGVALAVALALRLQDPYYLAPAACTAALLLLHQERAQLGVDAVRVLADLVLLLPLLGWL